MSFTLLHASNPWDGLGSFDDSEVGTSVFPILKRNPDARGLALGGNLGALEDGPASMWWNPATLSGINGYWTNFTHASVYGEFNQDFVATTIPWQKGKTFAFLANGLWTGDIENARDINEDKATFSSTEFVVGAALGWEVVPRIFSMGMSLYYLNALLADVNTQGVSADVGFRWNLKWDIVNSLSIHNISPGVQSDRPGEAPTEKLPLMIRWSIGQPMGPNIVDLYAWNLGLTKSNDGVFTAHAGWEQKIQNMIYVRAGKEFSFNDQEAGYWRGLSGGFGLQVSTLRLDYGAKYHGLLGFEHLLGVKFALFEKPARERLPLIDQARAWYAEGDCYKASILAEALLEKNRNSIEARSILQHCKIQEKVASRDYIAVIYSGDIEGQLFDLSSGDVLHGGLSRRMQAIDNLKNKYPINLSLDVGHYAAPVRNYERDSLLVGGLRMFNLDAIMWNTSNLQHKSYVNGEAMPTPFHPSALSWVGQGLGIPSYRLVESGGRFILVTAFSDSLASNQEVMDFQKEQLKLFQQKYPDVDIALKVLMWDASVKRARELLEAGLEVNLLLCPKGMMKSESVGLGVLASGSVGEIGLFRFYFDGDQLKNWDHQMFPINSGVEPHPQMAQFLQDSIRAPEDIINTWKPTEESHFLFLHSDREGDLKSDLYVKDPIRNYDYRVNHRPQEFVSPELGISRKRIAFVESVDNTKVLSIQNTVTKRSISISPDDLVVKQARFDPFENWIFYRFVDFKGHQGLMRVRPSGLESKLFLQEDWGKFQEFVFSPDARFVATQWSKADDSWIEHWSLRSKSHIRVNTEAQFAHTASYSPNGLYLAYLSESKQEDPETRGADIILYDVNTGSSIKITEGARVKSLAWSVDGSNLVYSSGDEVQDMNLVHISTLTSRKLIASKVFASEENPKAYQLRGRNGFLYERVVGVQRSIYWVSENGQDVEPIVELEGSNRLP